MELARIPVFNITKILCNNINNKELCLTSILTYIWDYKWSMDENEDKLTKIQKYYKLKYKNKRIEIINKSDFINTVYEKNISNIVANYMI